MTVIYCYLEIEKYKALKFHKNNLSYSEISASLSFKRHPSISAAFHSFQNK